MSAKPHVSAANTCSASRCLPPRPELAPGALPGQDFGRLGRKEREDDARALSLLGRRKWAQFGIDYDAAASPAMAATFASASLV